MAKGFVLANILASTSGLVVGFGAVASGACVPDSDVIATGETVVLVVEVFVWIGWHVAWDSGCGGNVRCWPNWNARG